MPSPIICRTGPVNIMLWRKDYWRTAATRAVCSHAVSSYREELLAEEEQC
jgi:hypothetical protein